jgi:hypothetical protein
MMTDPALLARANGIIDRLFALDEEVANGRAFRALLEDLRARDLSVVKEPHIAAIAVVRAGILRAFISSVMACLDRSDWREACKHRTNSTAARQRCRSRRSLETRNNSSSTSEG